MLECALVSLSRAFDLPLDGGGRYPGLYRLLSSSNDDIIALVSPSTSQASFFL